jgi:hypothetical protein
LDYYKIHREVLNSKQETVKEYRKLYLYKDRIVTKYREFKVEEVFDISYKAIGKEEGFLYLHTNQGVFSYTLSIDPKSFIEAYKKLIDRS